MLERRLPPAPLKKFSQQQTLINHVGSKSLPGRLPRLIGTIRGYQEASRDYWALLSLIGLGKLPLGRLSIHPYMNQFAAIGETRDSLKAGLGLEGLRGLLWRGLLPNPL